MNKNYLVGIALVLVIVVVIGIALFIVNKPKIPVAMVTNTPLTTSEPTTTPTNTSATPNPSPLVAAKGQVQSVDAKWNKYTNKELGFSIKFPKQYFVSNGGCKLEKDRGRYVTDPVMTPSIVYEDGSDVYLTSTSFVTMSPDNKTCTKTTNSLSLTKADSPGYQQGWKIESRVINNDADLLSYIKSRYGKACSIGQQKPSQQAGVFDIAIKGDSKDLDKSDCYINYETVLKYSPVKHRAIAFDLGQSYTFFWTQDTYADTYMAASLKFE